jgi:hypothetical protein
MTAVEDVIHKIHDSPQQAVLAVSGAGSQAIAWLLGVAGASRTVLEVVIPYGRLSMPDFLGCEPAQFVSQETSRAMARAAYRRGMRLREGEPPVVGLACTATIATDRLKRGAHRCYIATWDDAGTVSYNLRLAKGHRDRAGEEDLVSQLIVHALAEACGVEPGLPPGLSGADGLAIRRKRHPNPLKRLLSGEAGAVTLGPGGRMTVDGAAPAAVLPGSFAPLHRGHKELASTAAEILGTGVVFELSVTNVDKPPLAEAEVNRRLEQFAGRESVVLTRAETFRKKADLFPGCTFVIGWDTTVRLVAPKYYGGDESAMLLALARISAAGCRFLVAGRAEGGAFRTLADVAIPPGFSPLFQGIPESRFRADVSSTALRSRG